VAWVKIDDQLPDHPKLIRAGPCCAWLYIKGLCWSSRYLTDGFLPSDVAFHLVSPEKADSMGNVNPWEYPDSLVGCGLWKKVEGGYMIHDYLHYNPSKTQVLEARERDRQRKSGGSAQIPEGIQPDSICSPSPSPSPSRSPIPIPSTTKKKEKTLVHSENERGRFDSFWVVDGMGIGERDGDGDGDGEQMESGWIPSGI